MCLYVQDGVKTFYDDVNNPPEEHAMHIDDITNTFKKCLKGQLYLIVALYMMTEVG